MNVLVLRALDETQRSEIAALLARCEKADGHPALAEPQRAAAARRDLGAEGALAVLGYVGDELVGCAFITPAPDGATAVHVAVDPEHRGDNGTHDTDTDTDTEPIKTELLRTAIDHAPAAASVRLWLMQASGKDDAEAARLGFHPERDLLQMRVPLPLAPEVAASARPVVTRPFEPGRDDEAWLAVNNAAFADHPEQGGWTLEDLHARTTAEGFDPEGFLMVDSDDGSGLVGSCWTKIHRDSTPVMGEIYVISVNPARHSEGWGRALTVAGLEWISRQGITVGMLYTTASNTAAVKLYLSLGFTINHVDRSYVRGDDSAAN
jgi:mycothiol synthase